MKSLGHNFKQLNSLDIWRSILRGLLQKEKSNTTNTFSIRFVIIFEFQRRSTIHVPPTQSFLCRHLLCVVLYLKSSYLIAQILPPPPPQPTPPPPTANFEGTFQKQLEQKRTNRIQRDKRLLPPPISAKRLRARSLLSHALEKRPMVFAIDVSLALPTVKTSGSRSEYKADITSHLKAYIRPYQTKKTDQIQLWWGGRIAAFSGTGFYNNIPGRYGFTYFGPMIGLGKISLGQRNIRFNPERGDKISQTKFPIRSGWMLMSGIALLAKISSSDLTTIDDADEFSRPKGVEIDGTGMWAEGTYFTIHFGAIGVSYTFGLQNGAGKNFIYGAVGLSGWY